MYTNAFIVYALCDERTHQIRYIGCSEMGLSRPMTRRGYKDNRELQAWLHDLDICGSERIILVLATASDIAQLRAAEAFWISLGKRSGWPLLNKAGFSLDIEEPDQPMPKGERWKLKNWRRDPEVKAALARARDGTKRSEKPVDPILTKWASNIGTPRRRGRPRGT